MTAISANATPAKPLDLDAIRQIYGRDSPILAFASAQDRVEIRGATIPQDKARFRAEVIARLGALCYDEIPAFAAARAAGTIEVFTADEVPELNMQAEIRYTILRDGAVLGAGGYAGKGRFNTALYDDWGRRWNQSHGTLDAQLYYIRWPKA